MSDRPANPQVDLSNDKYPRVTVDGADGNHDNNHKFITFGTFGPCSSNSSMHVAEDSSESSLRTCCHLPSPRAHESIQAAHDLCLTLIVKILPCAGNTTYQRMSGSLLEGTDDEQRDLQPVTYMIPPHAPRMHTLLLGVSSYGLHYLQHQNGGLTE